MFDLSQYTRDEIEKKIKRIYSYFEGYKAGIARIRYPLIDRSRELSGGSWEQYEAIIEKQVDEYQEKNSLTYNMQVDYLKAAEKRLMEIKEEEYRQFQKQQKVTTKENSTKALNAKTQMKLNALVAQDVQVAQINLSGVK